MYGRKDGSRTEVLLAELRGTTRDNTWIDVTFAKAQRVRFVRIATLGTPSWVAWREIRVQGPKIPPPSVMPQGTHDGSLDTFASGDRCYANGWFVDARTPDEFARRAAEAVARGFTALKWNPFHGVHGWISAGQLRAVVEEVQAVREAVGDSVDLLIECHGLLDPRSAVLVAHELEPYRLFWLEEPVPPENVKAMADVRQRSPIPIATGERLFTKFGFVELLERQAADVIQPDVTHAGGILETRKIAAMAEAHFVSVAPHNSNSPVATAATLHLDACLGNFLIQELPTDEVPWRDELLLEPVEGVEGGALSLPVRPGLGVRLNERIAAAHPYQPADVPPVVTPEMERLAKKGKEA